MARESQADTRQERFYQETQERLPDIVRDLLVLESDPRNPERLEGVLHKLHALRHAAGEIGQDKIRRLAGLLEDCLAALKAGTVPFSEELGELMVQGLDLIEELVTSDPDWQPDLEQSEVVLTLGEILALARAATLETAAGGRGPADEGGGVTADDGEWPIAPAEIPAEEEDWRVDLEALGVPETPSRTPDAGALAVGDVRSPTARDSRDRRTPSPPAEQPAPLVELTVHQREFLSEAAERLQHMNDSILALEHAPTDSEAINTVFRLGHNLKGEGAMLGFPLISRLGHEMENLLARVREGRLPVDAAVIDTLFACVDALEQLIEEAKSGSLDPDRPLPVIDRLRQHLEEPGKRPPAGEQPGSRRATGPGAAKPADRAHPPTDLLAGPGAIRTRIAALGRWTSMSVPPEKAEAPTPSAPARLEAPSPAGPVARVEEAIRVNLNKLDTLINLASELLIDRSAEEEKLLRLAKAIDTAKGLARRWEQLKEDIHVDRPLRPFLRHPKIAQLLNMTGHLAAQVSGDLSLIFEDFHVGKLRSSLVVDRLQEEVMKVRMLPVGTVFSRFPRAVRDLARSRHKQVQLLVQGESTELDKRILEELEAPLMHIIRNAVDHGIETTEERQRLGKPLVGSIRLRAAHSGNQVEIAVEDDGRGLDLHKMRLTAVRRGLMPMEEAKALSDYEATQLMFRPGFSTAEVVTDISGRGVGMDVVLTNIKKIKGSLEVESRPGRGTRFIIRLPLTLAIVEALMVQSRGHTFYIPTPAVEEILTAQREAVFTADGRKAINFRGTTIPLVFLCDVLDLPGEEADKHKREVLSLVILRAGEATLAFAVERVVKVQDIVIKSLGSLLRQVPNVAGATILGSGEVAVILDVSALISSAQMVTARVSTEQAPLETLPEEEGRRVHILVVEDSLSTRELMKSILETSGYLVRTAVDGVDALQKIREDKPRLIVADIEMPRMDGFELTSTIRQDGELRDIPIIITTVHDKEEDRRRGLRVGANAYIVKGSFDQRNLLTAVEELMGS